MKSNSGTAKNKLYSSSKLRNLSMNKEQNPKHKPISKSQIYAKNQKGKTQNQVEKSAKTENPYL